MTGITAVTVFASSAAAPATAGAPKPWSEAASPSAWQRWLPLILAAIYFAFMMPIGSHLIMHYPDERHYAYGGARMVETGDWLIPYTPQGELRLKKPVIPYWFSAAGFEVMGIGVPGFRLFWVLAACAILLLTYAIARALGAAPPVALLGQLILAGNPVFMRAATNAIPDIPLTLFVTLAALGFVRVLAAPPDAATARWAWLGWIGIALAVLAKGLLPIVLVVALAAYLLLLDRPRLGRVLRPLPILAAIVLATAWYAYVALTYPDAFAAQFFGDQVTGNAAKSASWLLVTFPGYLVAGILSFLGWPLLLAWLAILAGPAASWSAWPSAARLLALWCATVIVVFTFSDAVDPRYLLPVMPAFAALVAAGIGALGGATMPRVSRICRWLVIPSALGGLLLAVPETLIVLQIGGAFAIAGVAGGVALWISGAFAGWRRPRLAPYLVGAAPVLAFALLALAMAPVVLPDRGTQFAAALAASDVPPAERAFVGDIHVASEVRLAMGSAAPFTEYPGLNAALDAGSCLVLTTAAKHAKRLGEAGFTVDRIKGGWREIDAGRLLRSIFAWHLRRDRASHGSVGYVATCRGTSE